MQNAALTPGHYLNLMLKWSLTHCSFIQLKWQADDNHVILQKNKEKIWILLAPITCIQFNPLVTT